MGALLGLVIVFLGLAWTISMFSAVVNSDKQEEVAYVEPSEQQIEEENVLQKMRLRKIKAEAMKWYVEHIEHKDNFKLLLRKELEVAQIIKGLKRRTISEIKYEKLLNASKTGQLSNEVLDMLNT